jgi:uncharacterized membrane protein
MTNHREFIFFKWVRLLSIAVLCIGIAFRVTNIDKKVYWHDETYTSLRISGYTMTEFAQGAYANRDKSIKYLQTFQRFKPGSQLKDTIQSLAVEDSQHPPLYYTLLRFWVKLFGNNVTVIRSLSILFSLLAFPCLYWLCLELFQSSLVAWIAIALLAVSPMHVLFAQEARQYALWTVTILGSSAAFLRAIRLKIKWSWTIYAGTLATSFYTFFLSGLVAVGHGIYVFVTEKYKLSKTAIAYLLSSGLGLLIFTPWIFSLIHNYSMFQMTTGWTNNALPAIVFGRRWLLNLGHIFFDLGLEKDLEFIFIHFILLCSIVYAFYFLVRHAPFRVWLFVIILMAATTLPLLLPDLIKGGQRSIVARYLFPGYISVQLAVAYLLSQKISTSKLLSRSIWQAIATLLILGGIISCSLSSQADTWWIKEISQKNPQVAAVLNQANNPLVISTNGCINNGNLLSLSYLLEPRVRLRLVDIAPLAEIPQNPGDTFIYGDCTEPVRDSITRQEGYELEPILPLLWRLKSAVK